jgi:hypothetical protein
MMEVVHGEIPDHIDVVLRRMPPLMRTASYESGTRGERARRPQGRTAPE